MSEAIALDSSVLVLNRLYMAVHVVSARRAFTLLCKDCAEVIDVNQGAFNAYDLESWIEISQLQQEFEAADHDDWVRTISLTIRVPRIIRLLGYDRLPKRFVHFNRRNIFARDDNRCQYCGKKFPTTELSLDHIVPRAAGGLATWDNIVCACTSCNKRKGGRTPVEANMKLIRLPREPKRSPVLSLKLRSPKYHSWKHFLDEAYWSVPLK
jgi:5-methylcytosine-specific restriction endonuclease McrA